MPTPANLVQETSVSTSTGDFTVASVFGRRTFNTAFGTGGTDVFDYFIVSRDANEWERGTGHLSSATTLVRDTVLESSNADALVNFSSGTKDVSNDVPAGNQITTDNFTDTSGLTVFTSSGSFSKSTLPSWVTHVIIETIGGGGGGNGSATGARGGGGGGAGYAKARIAVSALSASETVTIGAGGASGDFNGSPGSQTGTAGGTTSVGTHCVATGGGGGTDEGLAGALGGVGTTGAIRARGGSAHIAPTGTSTNYEGGAGAAGPYGGGANQSNVSAAGSNYGGGGGPGNHTGGGGGAGAAGIAVVSW